MIVNEKVVGRKKFPFLAQERALGQPAERAAFWLSPCQRAWAVFTPAPVKAYELYQKADPVLIADLLESLRKEEKELYQQVVAGLAVDRKLRPQFVMKKTPADQIAWLHKTLKLRTSDSVGEHLFQGYFMTQQKPMLATFCDAMGIEHDNGTVEGALPETLAEDKLQNAVSALLANHNDKMATLYLRVFNMQTKDGWPNLSRILESDERLALA